MSFLSLFFFFFTRLATVVLVTLTTRVFHENRYFDGLREDALWRFFFLFFLCIQIPSRATVARATQPMGCLFPNVSAVEGTSRKLRSIVSASMSRSTSTLRVSGYRCRIHHAAQNVDRAGA